MMAKVIGASASPDPPLVLVAFELCPLTAAICGSSILSDRLHSPFRLEDFTIGIVSMGSSSLYNFTPNFELNFVLLKELIRG